MATQTFRFGDVQLSQDCDYPMPLSSLNFILTLPIMLLFYWLSTGKLRQLVILLSSMIVYLYAGWFDFALLCSMTYANWLMHKFWPANRNVRVIAISFNLAILIWFKYRFFFGLSSSSNIVIPLGISFYIFQLISYQVEIQNKTLKSVPLFRSMFLYIFFFPHHQAGPIMKPSRFLHCFDTPRPWYSSQFCYGLLLILWGLTKKVWIADVIAHFVDRGFASLSNSQNASINLPLLAASYGVQIYADFSGYSDMAVGIARLFGFKLDRNFRQPYLSTNPSDFWQRWHVTLSTWLRDHLYFPLGGNRGSGRKVIFNLMIVMFLGGLWHGASWTFIVWGGIHGILLIIPRLLGNRIAMPRWLALILFQSCVFLAWLPFRAESLYDLTVAAFNPNSWLGIRTIIAILLAVGICLFSWVEQILENNFPDILIWVNRMPLHAFYPIYAVSLYLVLIGAGHATTFIYQRF